MTERDVQPPVGDEQDVLRLMWLLSLTVITCSAVRIDLTETWKANCGIRSDFPVWPLLV